MTVKSKADTLKKDRTDVLSIRKLRPKRNISAVLKNFPMLPMV